MFHQSFLICIFMKESFGLNCSPKLSLFIDFLRNPSVELCSNTISLYISKDFWLNYVPMQHPHCLQISKGKLWVELYIYVHCLYISKEKFWLNYAPPLSLYISNGMLWAELRCNTLSLLVHFENFAQTLIDCRFPSIKRPPPPSILILTVPRWYFCCGSLL